MERIIFSCYCFFDICCIGKANNESFQELGNRIIKHTKNQYLSLLQKGLCHCQFCKPLRFRRKSNWIVRVTNNYEDGEIYEETIYVCCREHIEKKIDKLQLFVSQRIKTNEICLLKEEAKF